MLVYQRVFFFSKAFLWEGFWDGGVLWVFQPPEAAIPIGFCRLGVEGVNNAPNRL